MILSQLEETRNNWEDYLSKRTGRLEYRFIRFAAVADELERLGFNDSSTVLDIGAGMCEFDYYLRTQRGFKGRYVPLDGAIDGTNIEDWVPHIKYDFVTGLEIIEHMLNPARLIDGMINSVKKAIILTTPNVEVLGYNFVKFMDPTHHSPIHPDYLRQAGFKIETKNFFGKDNDSLLATWERPFV